jgi:HPt (histidine-containing phosphotransfer) domain-containing protein
MPMNMRTTAELRRKIDKAARRSGRSLVQEVEHRVEQSFRRDKTLETIGPLAESLAHLDNCLNSLATSNVQNEYNIGKINTMWSDIMRRLDEIDARLISMRVTCEPPLHPEMLNG